MHIEFGKIASSEGSIPMYQGVLEMIAVTQHTEFGKRPIKVLDLGGGNGIIGSLLKQQLEESQGPLSENEFSSLIDYVNVDIDRKELAKSPGRKIHGNVVHLYDQLKTEPRFDFVLSVNWFKPIINVSTLYSSQQRRMAIESSQDNIQTNIQRAILLSTALLLWNGGKFVFSGFVDQETFDGIETYVDRQQLGLVIEPGKRVELNEDTKNLFVQLDTGMEPSDENFSKIKQFYPSYRQFTMRKDRIGGGRQRLMELLKRATETHDQSLEFLQFEDRFGEW